MIKRRRPVRKLAIEGLEIRTLMAGDVAAAILADGTLQLTGDQLDNELVITSPSPDRIEITGTGSTTINGEASLQVLKADVVDLVIEMEHGTDRVRVEGLEFENSVWIDLGEGNNAESEVASVEQSQLNGNLTILGQQGEHRVNLQATVGGDLLIDTGHGLDQVALWSVNVVGEAAIHDADSHVVLVRSSTIGHNLRIASGNSNSLGSGSDVDLFGTQLGGDLHIVTGAGDDRVALDGVGITGELVVNTGVGADWIGFASQNTVGGNALVDTGNGKDIVTCNLASPGDLFVGGDLTLDGGNGQDSLLVCSFHWGGVLTIDGFEVIV